MTSATISHQCRSNGSSQQGSSTSHVTRSQSLAVTIRLDDRTAIASMAVSREPSPHPCVTNLTFVLISVIVCLNLQPETAAISQGSRSACASPNEMMKIAARNHHFTPTALHPWTLSGEHYGVGKAPGSSRGGFNSARNTQASS
jgi:hypothetical protein